MKKQTKYEKNLRHEWKSEAEDEIILLQESIDELELDEKTVLELEKLINKFKVRLNDTIELFKLTPEIVFEQDDILEDMLTEVYYNRYTANEAELDRMKDVLEDNNKGLGYFIKAESIAEQIRVEAFIDELNENPYQLKLIA